jgi:hypothetical protein
MKDAECNLIEGVTAYTLAYLLMEQLLKDSPAF